MKKKLVSSALIAIILITTVLCNNAIRAGVTEITGGSGVTINTIVRNNYTDVNVTGEVELGYGKEYIIDFTKEDNLSKGLKALSKPNEVVYYNIVNEMFIETENIEEAIIKIEGKENKAIMTSLYNGIEKKYTINFTKTVYDGSKLTYESAPVTSAAPTSPAPVTSAAPTSPAPVTSAAPTSPAPTETLSAKTLVPLVTSTETPIVTYSTVINEIRDDYYTNYHYGVTFVCGTFQTYSFIDGQNQVYTIGKSHDLTFRVNADYSLFNEQVYLDNELVDVSNYTSKSGSTIITFKDEFVNNLTVGNHNLKIKFADSGVAETQFTMLLENNTKITDNPKTGDNISVYVVMMIVSIIGTTSIFIINKKRINKG